MVGQRKPKRRNQVKQEKESNTDWYLWLPCVGIDGVCPPLGTWKELKDGTYSLADVERYHQMIDELTTVKRQSIAEQSNG